MNGALTQDVFTARRHTIGDLLARTAARFPGRTALVWGELRETYAELDRTVNRVANAMAARGIRQGDRVVLLAHNSREFVLVHFALAKLGAISVPVNFMLNADEVAFIIEHAGGTSFIVEDALAPVMFEAIEKAGAIDLTLAQGWITSPGGSPDVRPAGWDDVLTTWAVHDDDSPPTVQIDGDDVLQIMYTSGTESRPKGVSLTSSSLIAQYVSCIIESGMTEDDVEIHSLPFYHCAQLHCFLTPDVYLGATSIVLPRPDPAMICETIERERVTKLFCPPTVWISLLRSPAFEQHDLSSLRKGYYGASLMPLEVLREIGERLPNVQLWNFYGQTEMAPLATILKPQFQVSHAGSAGIASLNVETRVVDDDDREVPRGEVGEIVHRSPHAMVGYWNDPEKTSVAFRNGWFHSGDLGVMDTDGYLTIVDRKKDMIKSGGENVASKEVEEALYQHPAVAEAAVFGIQDPRWIEAVTAAVVLRAGMSATPDELVAHARARLAPYKSPKHIVIVDALPKNPSGKVLKRELRTTYADLSDPA